MWNCGQEWNEWKCEWRSEVDVFEYTVVRNVVDGSVSGDMASDMPSRV